ncbi:MAG: hypothetical protein IAE88_15280 [Rhodobacteraceae bacterium]|nr:hypothetical protein [Paracoccaceae bacterium]
MEFSKRTGTSTEECKPDKSEEATDKKVTENDQHPDWGECRPDAPECTIFLAGAGLAMPSQIFERARFFQVSGVLGVVAAFKASFGPRYSLSDLKRFRSYLHFIAKRNKATGLAQKINIVATSAGAQLLQDVFSELPELGIKELGTVLLVQPAFRVQPASKSLQATTQKFASHDLSVDSFINLGAATEELNSFFNEGDLVLEVKSNTLAITIRTPLPKLINKPETPESTQHDYEFELERSVFSQHTSAIDYGETAAPWIIRRAGKAEYSSLKSSLFQEARQKGAYLSGTKWKSKLLEPSSNIRVELTQ